MKNFFASLFLAAPFLFFGCSTRSVQIDELLASPNGLPNHYLISKVAFVDQSAGYCGPATLTMAMRSAGQLPSVDEIAQEIFIPGLQGSLQEDLIGASRHHGLMAIPIHNLRALLTEVANGHPVIVFKNLGLSWAPRWHYALVLGYDLTKQEIIMHSGHDAFLHWSLQKFERAWRLGEYWGLVVLPAGELASSANEMAHVSAAAGLEIAHRFNDAEKSYRSILEKWPRSLVALIGLANISYSKGKRNETITLLRRAVTAHPDSTAAWHNLSVAEQTL